MTPIKLCVSRALVSVPPFAYTESHTIQYLKLTTTDQKVADSCSFHGFRKVEFDFVVSGISMKCNRSCCMVRVVSNVGIMSLYLRVTSHIDSLHILT